MADQIGLIDVPEIAISGTFPLTPDYPYGRAWKPQVHVHRFGSGNAKIEQRFWAGDGATRYTVVRRGMTESELTSLLNFFELMKGAYGAFSFNAVNDDQTTTAVTCRFQDQTLTFERLADGLSSTGVTLVEIPTTFPTYTLNGTATRFPGSSLQTALLAQVQRLIPLVKVQVTDTEYPAIYVSDRRCTIGSQLYQARLLDWDGIGQSIGNESDTARFIFGNADRVMRDLVNDVDLYEASIEFSLFHVGTGIRIDLWKGHVTDWAFSSGPEFEVAASDDLPLTLEYPPRRITRGCFKDFKSTACGYSGSETTCDKSFARCLELENADRHGGIVAKPQGVQLRQISGFLRRSRYITSTSQVSDTIYGNALREIYTDAPMEVVCDLASGREEQEFYTVLGIVGAGPITAYGTGHTLDDQPHHGPGNLGLRLSVGNDPNPDPFGLSSASGEAVERAAGVAFGEIRRVDEKGQQLTKLSDHSMKVVVNAGLSGFKWTAPGSRETTLLTNPIWIVINMLIRAKGLQLASASAQEELFDVQAAIDAADVCDLMADKLIGTGEETQFKFRGVIQETKPLRDWIQEVLMNCLGYFSFSFGRLRVGTRINSSVVEAFTAGNIIFQSLRVGCMKPEFNHLTANFADEEYAYAGNAMELYDVDHAKLGGAGVPRYRKGTINLSGAPSKSQSARIVTVRLREELGGISKTHWKHARNLSFRTTVLALNTEAGQVDSLTHEDMPGGSGEFRIHAWRLNHDYSIDITGKTTRDEMYDVTVGPKPADAIADAPAFEYFPSPERMVWHPNAEGPDVNDPMFGEDERTFRLRQEYASTGDGIEATLVVSGELAVNTFPEGISPTYIPSFEASDADGVLEGGNYYVAVCPQLEDGRFGPPSNVLNITVPHGSTGSILLQDIRWPVGTFTRYVVFACKDDARMICAQEEVEDTLPGNITWGGPFKRSTWTMPNANFDFVRVKAKRVLHAGVAGARISEVSEWHITCSDLIGQADDWTGRKISVISDETDGSAAIWNFEVADYDIDTATFVVSPDPLAAGVTPGAILIIRTKPTDVGDNWIEDAKWENGLFPSGMAVDEERGRYVRIWSGAGAGQVRTVLSNTSTRITVDRPWFPLPDDTSVFIVEAPGWEFQADGTRVKTALAGIETSIRLQAQNLIDQILLVVALGVDRFGNESPEDYFSRFREIWMYGESAAFLQQIQVFYPTE